MAPGCYWERYLQTRTHCKLLHVIARSEATRQSASPQHNRVESSTLGESAATTNLPEDLQNRGRYVIISKEIDRKEMDEGR